MLCVVIKGPTWEEANQQINKALDWSDAVELRLDCFYSLDLSALKQLQNHFNIPMIFTLRDRTQGGHYEKTEEERRLDLYQLATLEPDYLDLEFHVGAPFIAQIAAKFPKIKLIVSSHNFVNTPPDTILDDLYLAMRAMPAYYYKIATTACDCTEALRLLCWAKKFDQKLIAISMGSEGHISRILAPIIGFPITYAALDEEMISAPGQLTAQTLLFGYHYRTLNAQTKIYGLIGQPISQSISDQTHNHLMETCKLNAVYVKMTIEPTKLASFLAFARQIPFYGLSVTIPLKEALLPYLDAIDPSALQMGAVNTLVFKDGKIFGLNTDGIGALNAIETKYAVKGQQVIIIGAGGAAKAIAFEAMRRGAVLTIVNRDLQRGAQLAQQLHCNFKSLAQMSQSTAEGYDILINCTPQPAPIAIDDILPGAIIMDITTKPKNTTLLKQAAQKGCAIIYGYQMFVEQAAQQFKLWFGDELDLQNIKNILTKSAQEHLSRH